MVVTDVTKRMCCVCRTSKSKKSSGSKTESSHKHNGTVPRDSEQTADNKSDVSTSLTGGSTCRRRHLSHNSGAAANTNVTRGHSLINSTEWRKTNSGRPSEPNLLLNDSYIEGSTGTVGSTELPPGVTQDKLCCDSTVKNHVGAKCVVSDCSYKTKQEKQDCDHVTCDETGCEDAILMGNALEDDSMLDTPITEVTGEIILPKETGTQQMSESVPPTLEDPSADSSQRVKSCDLHTFGDCETGRDNGITALSDDICGTPEIGVRNVANVAPPMDTQELQKTADNGKYFDDGITGPCKVGDVDLLMGRESEGFSVGACGETENQAEVCSNHVESHARNGPTIFVKQPSSGADDSSTKRSEDRELYDASKQTLAAGLQSQLGRRKVCKTAYQRSQENLTQGARPHPKLEVKSFGAKDNLGVSSAESDGELTPTSPDSPRVRMSSSKWGSCDFFRMLGK